jgi:hypothetical protein
MPRKCCSTKHSITVENLIQLACQLSSSQLNELIAALSALRDAMSGSDLETPEVASHAASGSNGKSSSAHIAWKMINGCGPYPYLRFREGRIYRSYYLKGLKKD